MAGLREMRLGPASARCRAAGPGPLPSDRRPCRLLSYRHRAARGAGFEE